MSEEGESMSANHSETSRTDRSIVFPGTNDAATAWRFYNQLIAAIPDDIIVRDYALGVKWSYVEADCGMGVAWTARGGARRTHSFDLRGLPLKSVAELSKSWCFEEATIGVAALNAYYAQRERLDLIGARYEEPRADGQDANRLGMKLDAFDLYRPRIEAKPHANVVVVGHFPHVAAIADYANLTVLERNCSQSLDTPDPACEFVLPHADFAFITGVTIINKTVVRLLELARRTTVVMVGPSVVMSPYLFECGVETLAGSVVADPEKTRFAVHNGAGRFFGEALEMVYVAKP